MVEDVTSEKMKRLALLNNTEWCMVCTVHCVPVLMVVLLTLDCDVRSHMKVYVRTWSVYRIAGVLYLRAY